VRTYFYGIALKLLAADHRRLSGNEPQLEREHEPAKETTVEQGMWVRQALEQLEAGEREILMLREYEQLNYVEIAELLRLPMNTVRSRLFRARMALKEFLEPKSRLRNVAVRSAKMESEARANEGEA
jgi:RNA polymerase sigma-70 factor (ECF subfamily)